MTRSNSSIPQLAACAAALALSSAAAAQSLPAYVQPDIRTPVTALGLPATSTFTKLIHGDFDLNGDHEVIGISGSNLARLCDAATFSSGALVPITETPLDIVCITTGAPGARSRLGVVTATGLHIWSLSNGTWSCVDLGDPNWNNARAIASADINNDGTADIVGLNGNGTLLLRVLNFSGVFTPQANVPLGTAASGLALADIDLDGKKEIGLMEGGQFQVRLNDGSILANYSVLNSGIATTVLRRNPSSGALGQQFALVTGNLNVANDSIYVIGTGIEGPISMPSVRALALEGADMNGDGYDDLLVMRADSRSPTFLLRSSSAPSFSPTVSGNYVVVPVDSSMPGGTNAAYSTTTDFDSDGKADVVVFSALAGELQLRPAIPLNNPPPNSNAGPVPTDVGADAFYNAEYSFGGAVNYTVAGASSNTLRLWIDLTPWTISPTAGNALEIGVSRRFSGAGSLDGNHPVKRIVHLYDNSPTPALLRRDPLGAGSWHAAMFSDGVTPYSAPQHRDPNKLVYVDIPLFTDAGHGTAMNAGEWTGSGGSTNFRMYFYVRAVTVTTPGNTVSNPQRKYFGALAADTTNYQNIRNDTSTGIIGGAGVYFPFSRETGSNQSYGTEIKIGGFVAISSIPSQLTPETWPVIDFIGF